MSLCGVLEESEIVAKALRSLPPYKHKVFAIEEIQTVTHVIIDMLIGKIGAFELSEFGEAPPKYEFAFKATVSRKQKYDLGESSTRISRYEKEMNELEENERDLEEIVGNFCANLDREKRNRVLRDKKS